MSHDPAKRMSAHPPSGSRRLGVRVRQVNGAGDEVFGRKVWVTLASYSRIWSALGIMFRIKAV